ncbi:MAG TPA: aminotransferase class I/II-fold pyridoxal phosphate-dependent enzyme [Candidatus Hydrogenedentes bacterium]|nr:aminotransferase class I/II-fold pyridoxal phosphate-dependent enzyme [Candidatus Hydrogenedentota bacterium]HRT21492.1 aminotransferase class I/II-fold pyridoxal phosphate-dependent enzyme [Candidatus Hydrogenedentota bacterium]HRT66196.1 aminotransferase class I/II-fold pyridoxal phosphate-dependent enzyme [Candidatus Hydrogenedentota bacterium]
MKSVESTRRTFLKTTGTMAAGLAFAGNVSAQGSTEKLAIQGGPKAVTVPDSDAARWPRYGEAEEQAVLELVRRPTYDPIAGLEEDWKSHFGVPFAKAHFNGTSALASMFFALNLPPGSEIMVPSYTFFATIVPMRLFGLVPVFVDINPQTLNLDLNDAKKRLTKDTKAILPVHWIGLPADMDEINDWAHEKGLIVLEDSAHAHGAKLKGKYTGSWSRMAIYSFQATKPLPSIEGGLGVYQNREDFERATAFGNYDMPGIPADSPYMKYKGSGLGLKFRMHPFAAALARCQLKGLEERNEAGAKQVRQLNDALLQLPGLSEQTSGRKDVQRLYYSWNMLFIDEAKAGMTREAAVKALAAEGVRASALSYTLQHKLAIYAEDEWWHHKPVIPELPGSEKANATALALPYFTTEVPELVEQYVKAFEKVWAHRKELA